MTLPGPAGSANAPLVLRGANVFDSTRRTFQEADVSLAAGRIAALDGSRPEGAAILDATGCYIIPGLIDCHVHLTSSGDPRELNGGRGQPLPQRAWKAAGYAKATLEAGITTVRDLGAAERLNVEMASAIANGLIPGPRMFAAGLGVTMTGGHGHGFVATEADGPDGVRRAVREQLRAGATAIKLFASGGVMTPGVDPRSPSFTEDELRAGVEEAHKAFRVVAAHAQATDGIKNALRAGVDSVEHGIWLDDESIQLMLDQGTYLVATLTAPFQIQNNGLEAGIPQFVVDKGTRVLEDHEASFRAAVAAGVNIAMGTDQGTPVNRPGENAQELVRMVQLGLSPATALMASTAWAADLLKVSNEVGRLEPGLAADLVVLDRDPLSNIEVLTDQSAIRAVIQAGAVVRSSLPRTEE
ncbi:MAG TPA: amidohydrolase family protein [Tepidiformaceae bacterium]|nr:amidohydrolase family protein [Tepidiformaceae bacterium]